jgi:hypothetical protein
MAKSNLQELNNIMRFIEATYKQPAEYFIYKTEILIEAEEWENAKLTANRSKEKEIPEILKEKMERVHSKLKEREIALKRDRLISYSNMVSKNLFEKDEEINNATKLIRNRNYEEAIDAAIKIWAVIMQRDKAEMHFAKIKVLQIMIESTLSLVISSTMDTEGWLINLKSINNNEIMIAILALKMRIRFREDKEAICKDINK